MLASSVLSMKRVRVDDLHSLIICGLSNGDIYILTVDLSAISKSKVLFEFEPVIAPHAELKQVHDFGVNTLDATYDDRTQELLIASGGDDQQISVIRMKKTVSKDESSF